MEGDGTRGVIYTVDPASRRAVRREVVLVGMNGDRVVARGLAGVTQVVTSGAAWLQDAMRVEVKP